MKCQRRTSLYGRAVAVVTTVVLAAATIAGCTSNQKADHKKVDASAMNAIAADIQTKLTARPDVTKAEVIYQDSFTAPGAVDVSITAKAGANLNPIMDESIKLLWTSKLSPLESINAGVSDPADPSRGIVKTVAFSPDEKAAMQAKYGPRPK